MSQKNELKLGSYEILAGIDYSARPPVAPSYIFLIDVSKGNQEILQTISQVLRELILEGNIPGGERKQFGFITYDKDVHLYRLKYNLNQPQMVVLSDWENQDQDLPFYEDLVVSLDTCQDLILCLIESLPKLFIENQVKFSNISNAIQVAVKIFKHIGGRLLIFQHNQIKEEENRQVNNDNYYRESNNTFFKDISKEIQQYFICPSIFVFSESFINIINLLDFTKYLNGDIFYYYSIQNQRQNFEQNLRQCLKKQITWESVFRLRCSQGFSVSQIIGNYCVRQGDLLTFQSDEYNFLFFLINQLNLRNKTLLYEFEMDQHFERKINNFSIQTALLYTSSDGIRKIRCHNYIIPLSSDIFDIYNQADCQVLTAYIAKVSSNSLYNQNILQIRQNIIEITRALFNFLCIFQEFLKIQCLTVNIVKRYLFIYIKNLIQVKHITTDINNCLRIFFNSVNVEEMVLHFVPALFCIDNMQDKSIVDSKGQYICPKQMITSFNSLGKTAYLMDTGTVLIMYINK
ncbi:protein transport protein, putative, partial [Ichthyophthirius multifiliis]